MSKTWKTDDFRRLRKLEKRMATLRAQSPDGVAPPTREYAKLKKKRDELKALYGTGGKFNKLHRRSTRSGFKTVLKKYRRSIKRKDEAEWKHELGAELA
jgi:hypothetical protein